MTDEENNQTHIVEDNQNETITPQAIEERFEKEINKLFHKVIDKKTLEQYKEIMLDILSISNCFVTIIHDKDPDGITSGNLMLRCLKKLGVQNIRHMHLRDITEINNKNLVNKAKYSDYIIFQDIPIFSQKEVEFLLDYENIKKVLIIDHHPFEEFNNDKIVLIKSHGAFDCADPSKYCTAKLTYDLTNLILDMSEYKWIASIGMIGDMAWENFNEFIDEGFKSQNLEIKDFDSIKMYETKFGYVTKLVSHSNAFYPDRVSHVFSALKQSNNLEELESKLGFCKIVLEDVEKNINEFFDHAKNYNGVYVLELKSQYHISSQVATAVSVRNSDKIILVKRKVLGKCVMSVRNHNQKKDLGSAIKLACSRIDGANGGGHKPAAGARCRADDFDDLLEEFLNQLNMQG